MKTVITTLLFCISCSVCGNALTIAEKKAGLGHVNSDLSPEMQQTLKQVNSEHEELEKELQVLYGDAWEYHQNHAPVEAYQDLLKQINAIKAKLVAIKERWREMSMHNQTEEYALWQQPSTTLEQLVLDYGAQDFIYLVPSEIANMTVSINSNFPIPRSSWNEMLEIILTQNGVGVRQLNPFLRQLYLVQNDNSGLRLITTCPNALLAVPSNERVAFLLSPEPSDVRRTWFFLEKFVNPNTTVLQMIGRDILIVAPAAQVQELLKLYEFVSANRGEKEYKVVTLNRVDADEMANILGTLFGVLEDEPSGTTEAVKPTSKKGSGNNAPPPPRPSASISGADNGLKIIPLAQIARALFLIGTRDEIRKAEKIIAEVEDQVGESRGRVIYWYNTKHSEAEELAEVLSRIYYLMVSSGTGMDEGPDNDGPIGPNSVEINNIEAPPPPPPLLPPIPPLRRPYEQGFFLDDSFVVNNRPPRLPSPVNVGRDNFLVDPKTGAIVMVVEAEILPKLKELIKRLDVPKKMCLIEVLLFEKKIFRENDFGMNLLAIGSKASQTHQTAATFNQGANGTNPSTPLGIFEFLISRVKDGGAPAFDIKYRFLLAQDDIHINSCPSVLAINQTPATIEITDEISVNTGIYAVDTVGGVTLQNAYARARYGIKLEITPTIHMTRDQDCFMEEGTADYVTLDTDITFQTIAPGDNPQQPDVTTRHVVNDVRVPDGQTVIIGGLRQRHSNDFSEKIPFLGEIPGVGKLFSLTELEDDTTEMIIFITPKIIVDPSIELERLKMEEMCRRPGDIPAFLCRLEAAQEWESNRLFHDSITMLFGRRPERCVWPQGEYDGR